ncbi:MAG: DUF2309 domain-containing protein [Acetobacteraceae bacterium]|nr:DUF2309 domain-containing protein [Acetobacteraceae bacterium]
MSVTVEHKLTPTPEPPRLPLGPAEVAEAVRAACLRIAPLWPLKNFVAVNPFLGFSGQTFHATVATLHRVARIGVLMPRRFYLEAVRDGEIEERDLVTALADAPKDWKLPPSVAALKSVPDRVGLSAIKHPAHVATVAEVLTELSDGDRQVAQTQFMVDEISRWCAQYFDLGQSVWRMPSRSLKPFAAWLSYVRYDLNPEVMGIAGFRRIVADLPTEPNAAIAAVVERQGVPDRAVTDYLHQALLDISGWAAYARYLQWKAEMIGDSDDSIEELLAIRVVWGYTLFAQRNDGKFRNAWRAAMSTAALPPQDEKLGDDPDLCIDMVLQEAYEAAFQRKLLAQLTRPRVSLHGQRPAVQAAFCIDVRSEVYRRAFEALSDSVQTFGFAGFFGFPIKFLRMGEAHGRNHCPVLLNPTFIVCEAVEDASPDEETEIMGLRLLRRRVAKAWKSFKLMAVSSFIFVESAGLWYGVKLLSDSLGLTRTVHDPDVDGMSESVIERLGPRIEPREVNGRSTGFDAKQRVDMAEAVLRAMSMTGPFARLVMLTGHASTTVNNPHASSLDCGACGGYTGEANARTASLILNDPAVRLQLQKRGITIPEDTWFLGCLHDTCTDEIRIFDEKHLPATHATDLQQLREWLARASSRTRHERAALLGITTGNSIDERVKYRSRDWAQVRPEWGLAGNGSFIAAPRARTRGLNLGGRAFLHDYDWHQDRNFATLELIMTAPVVVGSWINLQYYGSTVNNQVFGCGNKVLHNVSGTIGVLEGNAGDLRVGLAMQSLHDGRQYVHQPVRLNVIIEAPIEAINKVIAKNEMLRQLADNRWLHLWVMDEEGRVSHRYQKGLTWGVDTVGEC